MVPFHIGLIKNTSKSEESSSHFTILRINFVIPLSGTDLGINENSNPVIVHEISYRYKDSLFVQNLITQIKEMIKDYKAKEQEMKEKEDIIEQEKLLLEKKKKYFYKKC